MSVLACFHVCFGALYRTIRCMASCGRLVWGCSSSCSVDPLPFLRLAARMAAVAELQRRLERTLRSEEHDDTMEEESEKEKIKRFAANAARITLKNREGKMETLSWMVTPTRLNLVSEK